MKKWKCAAITGLIMALYMVIEYNVRGYFAFGAEIMFPAVAIGVYPLIKERRAGK